MPDSAPAEEPSLAEQLNSAWDSAESASPDPESSGSAPSPSATTAAPAASPSPASPDGSAAGAEPRARGPDGKFVKAEAQAQAAQGAQPQPGQPDAASEFKIPEKWPAEVKNYLTELYKRSPGDAQWTLNQYAHFRNEAAQHANRVQQQYKSVEDLLAPTRQQRALKGVDDATYMRALVAADGFMSKNPAEAIRWLAQQHGLDLQQLANPQAGGQPEIPPHVRQLAQETAAIKQWIASQTQGAQQQRLREASNWIDSFASQKDATTGKPLYPWFDEVLPEVIVNVQYQVQNGHPVDVKAAYERAVRMNDTVWLKEQSARSEADRKSAEARRLREIEDAKRAGFSVSGSGGASSDTPRDNLRDELERLYDQHS